MALGNDHPPGAKVRHMHHANVAATANVTITNDALRATSNIGPALRKRTPIGNMRMASRAVLGGARVADRIASVPSIPNGRNPS